MEGYIVFITFVLILINIYLTNLRYQYDFLESFFTLSTFNADAFVRGLNSKQVEGGGNIVKTE